MSEHELSRLSSHQVLDNKSLHLPKEIELKKKLKEEIQLYIQELNATEGNERNIETLKLRKKLIESHGISIERIDNLEIIFLHYCSHIFKTGKHMTFERLEYEKSHLTMDRFFVFLKDFGLMMAKVDGVNKEVIDKNDLILLFKRVSINAKDLNFQQFVSCLDKIGLIYYDSMLSYNEKQAKLAEQRKKRRQQYLRNMKKRKAALEAAKNMASNEQNDENQDKKTEHQQENEPEPEQQPQPDEIQEHQNDKLIESLINDKNIEDPNEEINAQLQKVELENSDDITEQKAEQPKNLPDRSHLLHLTPEQKIQYFYQLINVDNAVTFKKKMRELNLPLFQSKHHRNMSQAQKLSNITKEQIERVREPTADEDQRRLQELRSKIEERKERDKSNTPYITKEDYEKRRKIRERQEIQASVIVRKDPRKKKIDINQLEIDLSSLSNLAHENINFKFNPQKLIQSTEEEDPYLQEYTSVKKTQRSQKRILSNFQSNDGRSQMMLEKMKKRAQEIQIRQRNTQSKYSTNSQALTSNDHQIRKNRLVEKLMRIYKQ